jgi:hypothetical protein
VKVKVKVKVKYSTAGRSSGVKDKLLGRREEREEHVRL